jgi:hypothetical protein
MAGTREKRESLSRAPKDVRSAGQTGCLHPARCGPAFSWVSGVYGFTLLLGGPEYSKTGIIFGMGRDGVPVLTWRGQDPMRPFGYRFGRLGEAAQEAASLHARSRGRSRFLFRVVLRAGRARRRPGCKPAAAQPGSLETQGRFARTQHFTLQVSSSMSPGASQNSSNVPRASCRWGL